MRDILILGIVFGSLPFIFRQAYIGVLMWVWISVMNPHRMTYGIAYDFNLGALVAVVTLISALLSKDLKRPPINSLTIALFLFLAWTGITTAYAFSPSASFDKWTTLLKTQVMAILIPMLFHRKEQLRLLIWVLVLSVGYFGIKGGIFVLLTGGGDRVYGPPQSYIEDNNAIAVALVMIVPLMRYLQLTSAKREVRWSIMGMMILCGVAALGSYSRGALLAISAMVATLWWRGRHKLVSLVVMLLLIPPIITFMPSKWFARMDTIGTYQEDQSANMRLNSWGTMWNMAKDRFPIGGGFEVADAKVYLRYSPDVSFPPQVAHSIYFQALGEHGIGGLFLYLLLLFLFWRHAAALVRETKGRPDLAWANEFGSMVVVTLVGFMVGGAFLSLVNFDVPYYLITATVAFRAVANRELRGGDNVPAPARMASTQAIKAK